MANSFVKAQQIAAQALGLLERDTVLSQFVWRDPVGNFKGALNDTVSIRVPAYTTARTRVMRSSTAITLDDLTETKVDVKLDTHVYKAIRVTDEQLTLDISNFGDQVTAPSMGAVVRKVDDTLAQVMSFAATEKTFAINVADPYLAIVDARMALNKANVPHDGRFLAVGTDVEGALLKSDRLTKFDNSGSSEPMREAVMGRIAGFTAVSVPGLHPQAAVAAHKSAFTLSLVAPALPAGAADAATSSYRGMSLRVLRDYAPTDAAGPADRLLTDTFMGVGVVKDRGTYDALGQFVPSVDGTDAERLVRAVRLTLGVFSS